MQSCFNHIVPYSNLYHGTAKITQWLKISLAEAAEACFIKIPQAQEIVSF